MTEPAKTLNWPVSSSSLDPTPEDPLRRAEAFREILDRAQELSMLIENTEKFKDTVRPHIYERVKADYQKKKEDAERRIEEEGAILLVQYQNYSIERQTLQATLDEKTDQLEELELRQRAGEYSEEETADQRNALKRQLTEHAKRISWLTDVVESLVRIGVIENLEPMKPYAQSEGGLPEIQAATPEGSKDRLDNPSLAPREQVSAFLVVNERAETQEKLPVVICPEPLQPMDECSNTPTLQQQAGQAPSANHVGGYITALEGSRKGDRFPLICSNITLGSSPGIDIRLNDPGIANFHARIVYQNHAYYLENFDSMGRCYVNGIHTGYSELKDGDIIRIGEIKLRVDFAATYR